jgi:hypothetical protein
MPKRDRPTVRYIHTYIHINKCGAAAPTNFMLAKKTRTNYVKKIKNASSFHNNAALTHGDGKK